MAATELSDATSHLTAIACLPAASTILTVEVPSPISAMAICAPSSAKRLANACPIPPAAPVMTATLSLWPFAMYDLPRNLFCLFVRVGSHVDRAFRDCHGRFLHRFRQGRMRVTSARDVLGGRA